MMTKTTTAVLLSLILVLAAIAQTSKQSPTPRPTAADKASPTDKASPPSKPTATASTDTSPESKDTEAGPAKEDLASPSEEATPATRGTPPPGVIPNPILYLISVEPYTTGGKNWMRYRYDVFNKADYPADMFAAAPSLPPCGANTNSSRTWVDFFDSTGKRLYGFCALSKPADLGKIWFALEEGVIPPSYVYIELNDRQANKKYKSNLADTTM